MRVVALSVAVGACASLFVGAAAYGRGVGTLDPALPALNRTVSLVIVPLTMTGSPGDFVQFSVSAVDTMSGSYIANAQFSLSQTNLVMPGSVFAGTTSMFMHSSTSRSVVNSLADRDGAGGVDSRDVLRIVNAITSQSPSADLNGDTLKNGADLAIFRAAYDQSVPNSGAPTAPFAGMIDALQTTAWGDTTLLSGSRMLGTVTVQIDPLAPVGSFARLDGVMLTASVYDDNTGLFARAATVQNGFGQIQVVPTPGAGGVLGLGVLVLLRRRR